MACTISGALRAKFVAILILSGTAIVYVCIMLSKNGNTKTSTISIAKSLVASIGPTNFGAPLLDEEYSIPNAVFYVWCAENATFKFRHYLSVKSVMTFIQPDNVVLYYKRKPRRSDYDTWLTDLLDTYPMFSLKKLPANICEDMTENIELQLFDTGGIYIREDVILTSYNHQYRSHFNSLTVSDAHDNILFQMRRRHLSAKGLANNMDNYSINILRSSEALSRSITVEQCSMRASLLPEISPDLWESVAKRSSKISLFVADHDFIPEHIWKLDSEAGRLLRSVMYNTTHFVDAVPNYNQPAPNIAHVIWINNDTMSFHSYLCVLSLVDVAKVDKLYVHGDSSPSGFYWNLVKDHPNIHLVHRTSTHPTFESVFGQKVEAIDHVIDIWKLYIMQRYGGLYVDTRALFIRPLDREIRSYDAVLSKDVFPDSPFPDYYQNGVMIGKPGARFWNLHLEAYKKKYRPGDYYFNSGKQPYKIKERFPELLHENPHLNVICGWHRCFPTWLPNYRDMNADSHLVTGSMKKWITDCYAIQHIWPEVTEYADHIKLFSMNETTLFVEVAFYILEKAGKKDFFEKLANNGENSIAKEL